ncbi:MAG: DNA double-strand break repair nuclease NurA [Dehalococcoidia bacterium]|nr:DNA double-strand break repair nuclease NurA [Dehalococcoidia bacterium]
MTLDITQIYNQVEAMAGDLKSQQSDYAQKLDNAMATLKSVPADQRKLSERIESSKTSWLIAGLKEPVALRTPAAAAPQDFTVVASDGSHIDVDRHHTPRLFLLNIGLVQIQYGDQPDAEFTTIPTVYFGDEMQTIRSESGKQVLIEGPLLGIKRGVEECRCLADTVCSVQNDFPSLGLVDGSLIMWGLVGERYESFVIQNLLEQGFLKQMERFHDLSKRKKTVVASYISFPRSTDVTNALRLQVCPYDPVDCDNEHCKGKYEGRDCDVVGGPLDRDLFGRVLANGERSALFTSRSSIIKSYGVHKVNFFYIKLDEEVARVEVPQWVADDPGLIEFTHSAIIDQCSKGFGYPVSLSEAHEQAVVTGADREAFWELVDRVMTDENMEIKGSLKQRSKKVRWI